MIIICGILMTETGNVSNAIAIASLVSERWLATDRQTDRQTDSRRTDRHTHRHR